MDFGAVDWSLARALSLGIMERFGVVVESVGTVFAFVICALALLNTCLAIAPPEILLALGSLLATCGIDDHDAALVFVSLDTEFVVSVSCLTSDELGELRSVQTG